MVFLSRRFLAGVTALFLALMWVPSAIVSPAAASGTHGGFEIDGNTGVDTTGDIDWGDSAVVGTQPLENDNAPADATVYSGNASTKEDTDPAGWTVGGSPPPKDDISSVYGWAKPGSSDVYFGFDRVGGSGTDYYYLELNKLQPTNPVTYAPVRSVGDVRFKLHDFGSGGIVLETKSTWTGTAWDEQAVDPNPTGYDYAVSANDLFVEFWFNLGDLLNLGPQCPPRFGSLQFRNATGQSDKNIKDFIKPLKLSAGSTCGQLKIVKHDGAGNLLGGATFRVTPDPRPIDTPAAYLDVLDNGPYDTDPADGSVTVDPVTPGGYHVTEHAAPTGYFLDSTDAPVTVPDSAANTTPPVFVDTQGGITVHKMTAGSDALGHSTFQLLDSTTKAVVATVPDTDGDGTLVFSGVAPGTYDLHESVAPQGYDVAADVTGVVVDQSHQSVSVEVHDAQHETALTVHKTDNAGTTPISGATFDLWSESNGVDGLQTAADGQTPADTSVGFTCTTGATGYCTANYTHATWPNQYYWQETSAPWPYTVPDAPGDVFAVQPITAANVTTTLFTIEVHDPIASLGTVASPSTTADRPLGVTDGAAATIGDQATVAGIGQATAGTLDFYLYKDDEPCDPNAPDPSKQVGSDVAVSGPGQYPAQPITTTVTEAGTYHWLAVLHVGNGALAGTCTDPGEQVIVATGALTLVKHVDKATAVYGSTLTYTFDANTTGDLDQTNVVVTDVVPTGASYVAGSAACTDTGPCTTGYDAASRTVSWQLGDIAHGSPARELVFKATVDKPVYDPAVGLPALTITNSGVVVSGETAATKSNEVQTAVVQVLGIHVTRTLHHPRKLAFTGAGLPPVTAAAIASLLIVIGGHLMSARRREH